MNVTIIHVGDFKEDYFRQAEKEYAKRLSAYCSFKTVLVKEEENLKKEAEKVLSLLPAKAKKVALCVEGKQLSSEEFAVVLDESRFVSSEICFVIGSSCGLDESVKRACDIRLSFSKMTLPHRLARILLEEQIYRAFTIIAGKTYHK
ncbi:MAG: 23S rRNA (pseudouridine(1915)-N(3))-methyltransferase RlmH [Clostridia bacterium]|nr:23S rRNA (pseudouridine(1915)-N(3))-methyltransferase RlmH [Clostridia bacterium]